MNTTTGHQPKTTTAVTWSANLIAHATVTYLGSIKDPTTNYAARVEARATYFGMTELAGAAFGPNSGIIRHTAVCAYQAVRTPGRPTTPADQAVAVAAALQGLLAGA